MISKKQIANKNLIDDTENIIEQEPEQEIKKKYNMSEQQKLERVERMKKANQIRIQNALEKRN